MTKAILVHGEEPFLCDEFIQGILPEDLMSVEKYDMSETPISEVLLSASQGSLFGGDEKTIILNDCEFLGSKKLSDKGLQQVLEFINDKDLDVTIIFRCDKVDNRKKLVKTLLKSAEVFEGKVLRYPQKWLTERAKKYGLKLTNESIGKIILEIGTDLYLLDSELQKISSRYPNESKITPEMLDDILSRTLESDVFKLIDRVMNKQSSAIDLLQDLLMTGSDEIKILLLIARQFRIIEQIKVSNLTGTPVKQVLKGLHHYTLQKASEQADDYTLQDIRQRMHELAELDLKMKRGQVDKTIALETLILKWI